MGTGKAGTALREGLRVVVVASRIQHGGALVGMQGIVYRKGRDYWTWVLLDGDEEPTPFLPGEVEPSSKGPERAVEATTEQPQ